ncbi:MAG TPA: 3-keto-5-aminohexanoate cleavage protein [Thermoleophilia bacterium]|nr:3-keto-5-aminohexanoate cleavage protein [Thermoleophilia bacterium]
MRPRPVIITAALTGSRITKEQCPAVPITPAEIAAEGIAAWRAGAAVVHIHVRDASGQGAQDMDAFREVVGTLRAETDVVLCLTTSGIPGRNLPTTERIAPLALRPEMASFDAGTIQMDAGLFVNEPAFLDALAAEATARGVKLEFECFTLEMVGTALRYHAEGKIPAPLHFQFVTGTRHGMPATAAALTEAVALLPDDATWSVIGVGRNQTPMAMLALAMGGHVRVGLEDNIHYRRGELATGNAQLVERAVRLAGELERPVATPGEARRLLGLG